MKIKEFEILGPKLIDLDCWRDDRGFFVERFHLDRFRGLGLPTDFVQDNFSCSIPRTLRGLHYQFDQPQGKLVTCLRGKIFDVAVDIRKSSPTLGQHIAVELSGDHPQLFWIPPGFAHGFVALGDDVGGGAAAGVVNGAASAAVDVMYKVDCHYNGKGEGGIIWNDPTLNIKWPISDVLLSPKDAVMPTFKDYLSNPKF